jgi:hypothetical protein
VSVVRFFVLGVLLLASCATTAPSAEIVGAPVVAEPARTSGAASPVVTAADVLGVLERYPAKAVDAALRRALLSGGERPARLVGPDGPGAPLQAVIGHARALGLASEPPVDVGLDELEEALAALGPDAREAWVQAEVLGWRTAYLLARELGGPLADEGLMSRLDVAVLADADRLYERLTPTDPHYGALVRGLTEFRRLAAATPSEQVVGRTARWRSAQYGASSDAVRSIRRRLAEVGFPADAEADERRFDSPLRQALLAFQGRFGLEQSGQATVETLDALARPLAERAAEIGLVLAHLRSTRARLYPDRIVVNIPAFQLRHFVGDRVDSTHNVVVGSVSYAVDEVGGRAGLLNLTPTLESTIKHLVLNPSWGVPQRIKERELDRRAERNPDFYDSYDVWVDSSGVERVRQRPGPGNALGQVKFVFEGGDGVYLHDTPLKSGFTQRVRALSHGCVRVQDALELARRVLEVDGHPMPWSRAQSILARRRETEVTLTRALPIIIEYVTVGADEEGTLRFYPDLYGWGVVRRAGKGP